MFNADSYIFRPLHLVYGIGFVISLLLGVHIVWALVFLALAAWGPEIEYTWRRR
jgi:hypothetical protein